MYYVEREDYNNNHHLYAPQLNNLSSLHLVTGNPTHHHRLALFLDHSISLLFHRFIYGDGVGDGDCREFAAMRFELQTENRKEEEERGVF